MRRRVAVLLSVLACLMLTPAMHAAASPPTREDQLLPPTIRLRSVCPDIRVIVADILANTEVATTWSDANGDPVRTIVTGRLVVRLTNPDSGVSIVRNISGPGETVFHANGSTTLTATGSWFNFYAPGQLGAGSAPTSFLTHGRLVIDTDANGVSTIVSRTGTLEDVCATLA